MDEQLFYGAVNRTAREAGINPLLLISGIEGLYTFRDVRLNAINYGFLDSLILTIFALRIGDSFHSMAQENLTNPSLEVRQAAGHELQAMSADQIARSTNQYLQSFAAILDGKIIIRNYHEKALEVAALEVGVAHHRFGNPSISSIILDIGRNDSTGSLGLASLLNS